MSGKRLRTLLEKSESIDELWDEWTTANTEAAFAWAVWRGSPSRMAYAVYRAAADRADAAQDALATATHRERGQPRTPPQR